MKMKKIAILLSVLVFGDNSYACFHVDSYQLEKKSFKNIQKYKSIFESIKFSTMDYIKYLKNIKAKDIPKKLILDKVYLLKNNIYQAECAETVRKDLNHIVQFMDIFCELRLAKDKFNEKLLIQKIQQFLVLDNDLSEKHICSASRFLKKLENNNKKYMNTLEYPYLVVDKSLFEFLKPIINHYKNDIDRYVRDTIIQPDEKHLYNNPLFAYIDRSFKKSGYMQFQSLMNELHSSFSQNSLALFRFF
jgi:flagellar biosynthesis regulator FlbT